MAPLLSALLAFGWLAAVTACALWLPRLGIFHAHAAHGHLP
jgi:hypothetical protein